MVDKNEKYVFEEEEGVADKDRRIIRTYDSPVTEKFTVRRLEEEIARLEQDKTRTDAEIAKVQEKIDEATEALGIE